MQIPVATTDNLTQAAQLIKEHGDERWGAVDLSALATKADVDAAVGNLADVAASGSYNDLKDKPDVSSSGSIKNFTGKRILVIGGSLSDNSTYTHEYWHDYLSQWLGFEVVNFAVAGSGYRNGANRWVDQVETYPLDVDGVIVFGSTNDLNGSAGGASNYQIGSFGDAPHRNTTVAAAIALFYDKMLQKYPNIPIVVMTPTPSASRPENYGDGSLIDTYSTLIKRIAAGYSLPCLDLFRSSGLRPWIDANNVMYFRNQDRTHPNGQGHLVLANAMLDFIVQFLYRQDTRTAPQIVTTELLSGSVGQNYTMQFMATGALPLTWTITDGALPDGLTMDTDGLITGTPTLEESAVITVQVTNNRGSDTKTFELSIEPAATVPQYALVSTGAQYMDIGLKGMGSSNAGTSARVVIDFELTNSSQLNKGIMGAVGNTSSDTNQGYQRWVLCIGANSVIRSVHGYASSGGLNSVHFGVANADTTRYLIDHVTEPVDVTYENSHINRTVKVNGSIMLSPDGNAFVGNNTNLAKEQMINQFVNASSKNLYLFSINDNPPAPEGNPIFNVTPASMKLYSLKAYNFMGGLIADMVPVPLGNTDYSAAPAPSNCLWDKVRNQYFENIGTGTFGIEVL